MTAELFAIDAEPAPDSSVVERLEYVLELARKGEVSSVAVAFVLRDGRVNCAWSKAPSQALLLGAISRLKHRFNRHIDS